MKIICHVFFQVCPCFIATMTKICSKLFMFISVRHVSRIFLIQMSRIFMHIRKICFHFFYIYQRMFDFFMYQVKIFLLVKIIRTIIFYVSIINICPMFFIFIMTNICYVFIIEKYLSHFFIYLLVINTCLILCMYQLQIFSLYFLIFANCLLSIYQLFSEKRTHVHIS